MTQQSQQHGGIMSAIDWRGLCEELVNALDAWQLGGSPLEDEVEQRLIDRARAVLSRWGRPAPAPAGEVAKLVQPPGRVGLTWQGVIEGLRDVLNDESEDAIQRVWQRSRILDAISVMEANPCPAPVPVAVSERLPGPDDCDAEGKCWMGYWDSHANGLGHSHKTWFWTLEDLSMVDEHTHWLPANALPLPSNTESGGCSD